jgi:hypothetical protein
MFSGDDRIRLRHMRDAAGKGPLFRTIYYLPALIEALVPALSGEEEA